MEDGAGTTKRMGLDGKDPFSLDNIGDGYDVWTRGETQMLVLVVVIVILCLLFAAVVALDCGRNAPIDLRSANLRDVVRHGRRRVRSTRNGSDDFKAPPPPLNSTLNGCGGNENNFKDASGCNQCWLTDANKCPQSFRPVAGTDGNANCGGIDETKCSAPNTYCKTGTFIGICCSSEVADKEAADANAKMPPVNSKFEWPYPQTTHFPGRLERFGYRTYNWLENRTWPVRPLPFIAATGAMTAYQVKDIGLQGIKEDVQKLLKPLAISTASIYTSVYLLRRFLKYFYFSYKGYLFENPKKPSFRTILWGVLRKVLLTVAPPNLSSCDRLLPNLPIPHLRDTVERYVDSMRHFMSEEEHQQLVQSSKSFLQNEGPYLQRYAWILHKFTDCYVTELWEKYIYMAGRYPLLINSSVAQCTMYGQSDLIQAYQVARLIYIENIANLALDKQKYLAVGDGLMSTRHYKNIYNGCRIPGVEYDHFQWNAPSRHVVVVNQGTWYKVDVCDSKGKLYTVDQLAKIITELMNRDDKSTGYLAKIASLTTDRRTEWSENRRKFFLEHKTNSKLLQVIETAQFVMSVDADLNWGVQTPSQLSKYMKDMLAGDGSNRWVDKTMNYAVDASGRAGATGEHSPCDGAELDHLCENVLHVDKQVLASPSKEEQMEIGKMSEEEMKTMKLAEKLDFQSVDGMESEISRCFDQHQKASDDLHLHSLAFMDFGKGRVKNCGISPDGFVQMAIQLANYQDQGKFQLTYEPGSVRFFANTRTETLRPVTNASCEFVKAMLDEKTTQKTRRDLLKKACSVHVNNCKEVMVGRGVDRHLFILCAMSKGLNCPSPFLDSYAGQKWLLSTSNIPNMTNLVDEDSSEDKIMLGASFGAVAQDGYGICYRFAGNRAIMAHITSYHSSNATDSDRFAGHLREAFHSLAELFDDESEVLLNNNVAKSG